MAWEWVLLTIRARMVIRRLQVERIIRDDQGAVQSLWAGRSFVVDVAVHLPEGLALSHLILSDRLPFGVELSGMLSPPARVGKTEHIQSAAQRMPPRRQAAL